MAEKNPVVILGVIYNTHPETIRFIESIKLSFGNEVKLILVDNSENPPDSFFTEKIYSCDFVTYIKTEKNVGYFQGAKLGLMHFMGNNHNYPQWTIVCNVDIIFETLLLSKKLGSYENVPVLGMIAPAIISDHWKTDFNPFLMSRFSLKKF
jgi:GT2 family glycosyltransferase